MADRFPEPGSPLTDSDHRLRPAPWSLRDLGAGIALTLIILALLYTAAGLIINAAHIRGNSSAELGASLVATLVFQFCLFGIATAFSIGKYGRPWPSVGFRSIPWSLAGLPFLGIIGAYLIVGIYIWIVTALGVSPLQPAPNLPSGVFSSRALTIFGGVEACLVAPIVEESYFRGFIFHGLLGKWIHLPYAGETPGYRIGFWGAALPSGVLFALFHAQIGLIIPFTGVGVLFAWLFYRSGSLWTDILTHAGFNLISFGASLAMHH